MFATAALALLFGHYLGDYWVQTQHQADHKGLPGLAGRLACLAHVGTYTAAQAVFVVAALAVTGERIGSPWLAVLGLLISAGTHYAADRRVPLRKLADLLRKSPAWLEHGGGLALLDQAWHWVWIGVAALAIGAA